MHNAYLYSHNIIILIILNFLNVTTSSILNTQLQKWIYNHIDYFNVLLQFVPGIFWKKSLFWILTNIISIPPSIQKKKKPQEQRKKKISKQDFVLKQALFSPLNWLPFMLIISLWTQFCFPNWKFLDSEASVYDFFYGLKRLHRAY